MAADPPTTPPPVGATVVQRYARLLQLSLSRTAVDAFDLAGIALYQTLQQVCASLQRCCRVQADPTLAQWAATLTRLLPTYAPTVADLGQAHTWVTRLRVLLAEAALPTATTPGAGSAEVQAQLQAHLTHLPEATTLTAWLADYRQHLVALTARYAAGICVCYDIVGVPRTNNAQESLFGQLRRRCRRQTGFKQIRRLLLRQGAWAIFTPTVDSVAALQRQLQQVPWSAYAAERARGQARHAQDQLRWQWRHAPATVLQNLETLWSCQSAKITK